MKKAFGAVVFLMLVFSAIALSEIDDYYGSWAFYALGTIMVTVAYLRKGDAIFFWAGIFVMGVTFGAANVTSEVYRETSVMYQEAAGSTESSEYQRLTQIMLDTLNDFLRVFIRFESFLFRLSYLSLLVLLFFFSDIQQVGSIEVFWAI